jgi:very-short-patch-repair endonuclease
MSYKARLQKVKDTYFTLNKKKRERSKKQKRKESRKEQYARKMREQPTPSEARLYNALVQVRYKCGWVVSSQVVIGPYIADIYIPNLRVVVEVDGGYHAERIDYDARRDRWMWGNGYRVIRVNNEEVWKDLNGVVYKIFEFAGLGSIHPKAVRKYGELPGLEKPA